MTSVTAEGGKPGRMWRCAQEAYRWRGIPGAGMSVSSNRQVLQAAAAQLLDGKPQLDLTDLLRQSLQAERQAAGSAVAGQDVASILHGGVGLVHTLAGGDVSTEQLACDHRWLGDRTIFAYRTNGRQHRVPAQFCRLFTHPRAGDFVTAFTDLAQAAAPCLPAGNLAELGRILAEYRRLAAEWTSHGFVSPDVADAASLLERRLGASQLAWKPPGGGGASALVAFTTEPARAVAVLRTAGWRARCVRVAGGVRIDRRSGGETVVSAPHRIDVVGFADLGQDPRIGRDGTCLAIATTPRSTVCLRLRQPVIDTSVAKR